MTPKATESWRRWKPTGEQAWDLRRVWHLHRRAGFAGNWHQLQLDLNDGVDAAVDRFLAGDVDRERTPQDFDEMSDTIGAAAASSGNPDRLKAWWVYRMLYSPDPLAERLTLMWHNHFATSNLKVENVALMWQQNELMRQHSRGSFRDLLTAVVKHPAILLWLDAAANRREHPNENLARELMELFTLGVGNYTESDVKEAARCLTGWAVSQDKFRVVDQYHDDGKKTLLGRSGQFDGDDLIDILLSQPQTANRLAWRLCDSLLGEDVATQDDIEALGARLHKHELNIALGVETILRSNLFWSNANLHSQIAGPVEFMVGTLHALEMSSPPPSTLLLSEQLAGVGQDLFYPPNVFGWSGGRAWINTRSILARSRFVTSLIAGKMHRRPLPLQANELVKSIDGRGADNTISKDEIFSFFASLLLGQIPERPHREVLERLRREVLETIETADEATAANQIVVRILTSPEGQLC